MDTICVFINILLYFLISGILSKLQKCTFFIGVTLLKDIFDIIIILSITLK